MYSLNTTKAITLIRILNYVINDKHRCDIGASVFYDFIFTESNRPPFSLPFDGELFLHLRGDFDSNSSQFLHLRGDFDSNSSQVVNLGIIFLREVTKQPAMKKSK